MTDNRGYMRNGKLEEYDQRAKGANSAGFDKRGYYVEPYRRNEVATGLSEEEWAEVDKSQPSLYFYPDGRPKPGTFSTPEEEKALKEAVDKMYDEIAQEAIARQRNQELAREESRRKSEERKQTLFYTIVLTIGIMVFFKLFIFVASKISDYQIQKDLEKRQRQHLEQVKQHLEQVNQHKAELIKYIQDNYGAPYVRGKAGFDIYLSDYYQRIAICENNYTFNDYEFSKINSVYLSINGVLLKKSYDSRDDLHKSIFKTLLFADANAFRHVIFNVQLIFYISGYDQRLEIPLIGKKETYYATNPEIRELIHQADKFVIAIGDIKS